ncbi:mechanosensitive ion channel family protein [Falsihalocynthiibacter sp. SS001]|uniref:mechanosensitive ion channel family protein n=1 Tax=Falsihalocynthiibacter sp. SS001 TaxID=3349698 RepID=UPI0036D337F9
MASLDTVMEFGASFLVPGWRLYQLIIIIALFGLAVMCDRMTHRRIRIWMRTLRGRPKWQLRTLVLLHRRIRLILFVIFAWIVVFIMRELTWPSRSYFLANVATVASAWLFIIFAVRFIHNRALRRAVMWGAWIYVTLHYIGQIDETSAFLDSIAVEGGDVRLSALTIVKACVILAVIFFIVRITTRTIATHINRNEDISPSMRVLFVKIVQIVFYGTSFFLGLKAIGFDLTGLAFLSGAIGVGLGFGLQKVVSNLVSGVIILLDKSIKPGDVISLGETFGWINELGARYVSVVTRDGREYLIPNEDLITGQVVNWSHSDSFVRLDINFGTAYSDDPHVVRKIAIEAAKSVRRVLRTPNAPVCHIVNFGDSSVDFVLRFWISDSTAGLTNVRGDVYLALWDAFKEHDISIPFPQREIRMLGTSDDAE